MTKACRSRRLIRGKFFGEDILPALGMQAEGILARAFGVRANRIRSLVNENRDVSA